ncbi:MAG: CHRD domain-containing protein [Bacteroidota bacterium]
MNIRRLAILSAAAFSVAATSVAYASVNYHAPFRTPLFAVLVGGNEVSNAGEANAGHPQGRGSATVILPDSSTLCFAILVTGIDTPVAAHLHNALAGQNGPIAVTLTPPENGDAGAASGCISDLNPAVIKAIRRGPGAFYVNVHTDEFPDGALRGQLF